jgi:hypothetical protein
MAQANCAIATAPLNGKERRSNCQKEIMCFSKNSKKTWNFLGFAPVGIFRQREFYSFLLTVKGENFPEHFQQGNRHGHNSSDHSDPVTDRRFTGLSALQKLGLWPVRYYRRGIGGDTDPVTARQDMKM